MIELGKMLLYFAITVSLSGCVTMGKLAEDENKNKIFCGTIAHIEMACSHGNCIDSPFSLIADVALLPATVPWTIYNYAKDDGEEVKE